MAEISKSGRAVADMLPRQIVEELDRYIIGQHEAKRAVAIALRNRYRRERLPEDLRREVIPKNILMIGPTGVGKTEIARRLAKLADAPFIKVEATKYTEVGYVGRDVESMIRELAAVAVHLVTAERREQVKEPAFKAAVSRLVTLLTKLTEVRHSAPTSPFYPLFHAPKAEGEEGQEQTARPSAPLRVQLEQLVLSGAVDDVSIQIEVEDKAAQGLQLMTNSGVEEVGVNLNEIMGGLLPKQTKSRRVTISEALKMFSAEESEKMIDMDSVVQEAIERTEERGIVFLDELDKIASKTTSSTGPDVSREGVQRDILPIVEGSTVATKYGPVHTEHILFIAAGAFHVSKPADLIPELQGRFPIRVTLTSLAEEDLRRILTEPCNALTRQYEALLATEGVELSFADDGIEEMARLANEINVETEDIGARRLHTILERVLENVSFTAAELDNKKVVIDRAFVQRELQDIVKSRDLSRFIL